MGYNARVLLALLMLMTGNMSCSVQQPVTGDSATQSCTVKSSTCISPEKMHAKKVVVYIILGSTRKGRTSDKIARAFKRTADSRTEITAEIIDLRDYALPFLDDEVAPVSRKKITDPRVQKWSDKIKTADAFVIVVPEYNTGYPGVLKNSLDSLYKEWNNKPVGFIGYSGGPSGGASAITQLRKVTTALEMIPVAADITIPQAWKAFDEKENIADKTIERGFDVIIDQLIKAQAVSKNKQ